MDELWHLGGASVPQLGGWTGTTNRVQLSELFYSLLSTASKISLFAAIVFSEDWEGCGARR